VQIKLCPGFKKILEGKKIKVEEEEERNLLPVKIFK